MSPTSTVRSFSFFKLLPLLALLPLVGAARPCAAADVGVGLDIGPVETPEEDEAQQGTWRYRIGLGLGVTPDYVGSDDYRLAPIPQITAFKGPRYVNLTGTYLFSNLLPTANWRLGPTAKFIRGDRCNAKDDKVSEQKCQADALMLGGTGGYAFDVPGINNQQAKLTPAIEILGDVTKANEGMTIEPQINFAQRLSSDWRMALRGFGIWGSDNYEGYYFGVDQIQARDSGLPQYDADGGFQQFGLLGVFDYDITKRWRLSLLGRYARLIGDAQDSPLVDGDEGRGSANQFLGGAIVSYVW
jgi:outer membrane protein